MPKVSVQHKQLVVGKERVPLISGEVHYWRLNPGYWKNALARVRELGLHVISTYIPWHYHEYERGVFDFHGTTNASRDLQRFLELCQEQNFKVIFRPGPYIYSEWPNDGVPDYAYQFHKLHPQFLKYAEEYLSEVMQVARPFLATEGGPIILVQADNEIDPWPDRFGHQYGLDGKPGMFQDFLKSLYRGKVSALNTAWGTRYRSFDEVGAFIGNMLSESKGLLLKGDLELRRNLDYLKFKHDYSSRYAEWTVKCLRKLGVNVPIYLNLYPFFYAHDWRDFQSIADFVGVDLYPTNEFHEDRFEHRKFLDKIRYLRSVSKIPFIAEFEAGIWHERQNETGAFSPNHYRLLVLSALLAGAAGWNWYMLVNRDNWYMSPINEWGRKRNDVYDIFRHLVEVYQDTQPAEWQKVTSLAVTFNPIQYAGKVIPHDNPLLTALYEQDIDYDVIDVRSPDFDKPYLIYSGSQWLDEKSQRNLRRYVEKGGTLIALQDFPRKNENFKPVSIIGFEDPKSILFEFRKWIELPLGRNHKIGTCSTVYAFDGKGGQRLQCKIEPFGTVTLGYIKKIGKGRLVHLGLEPQGALIRTLLDYLKVPMVSRSLNTDVKTAVFKRGKDYYLVAVNSGSENKTALIHLPFIRKKSRIRAVDVMNGGGKLEMIDHSLPLNLPRKDGTIIRISF